MQTPRAFDQTTPNAQFAVPSLPIFPESFTDILVYLAFKVRTFFEGGRKLQEKIKGGNRAAFTRLSKVIRIFFFHFYAPRLA